MYQGKLWGFYHTGPANQVYVVVRPPKGVEWRFLWLRAGHTNVATTTIWWTLTEGEDTTGQYAYISKTTKPTGEWADVDENEDTYHRSSMLPLILTHDIWLKIFVPFLEAGKKIDAFGAYYERPENYDLQIQEKLASRYGWQLPVVSQY